MTRPMSMRQHYDAMRAQRLATARVEASRPLTSDAQVQVQQTIQAVTGAGPASLEAAPAAMPVPGGASPELRLFADMQRLKELQSVAAKVALKREIFPTYLGWIDGTLAVPSTAQNDMLMHLMVWALDTNEYEVGSRIAEYAILNGLVMPEPYKRDVASIYAEQLAEGVLSGDAPDQHIEAIERAIELTRSSDMVDEIRAKLYKALGEALQAARPRDALTAFEMAKRLNPKVGVTKLIEKLQRLIKSGGADVSPRDEPDGSRPSPDAPANADAAGTTVQPDDTPAG